MTRDFVSERLGKLWLVAFDPLCSGSLACLWSKVMRSKSHEGQDLDCDELTGSIRLDSYSERSG